MPDAAFEVEYHPMRVGGVPGRHVVAKVGRISSPPVAADAVPDPRASALACLADVLRGGTRTRAYSDFTAFKRSQREDPAVEWSSYVAAACLALGCDRLEPLELAESHTTDEPGLPVTYHAAEMNEKPYVVARVGPVFGGPAAVLLLRDPAASALDRLADVFRAGTSGRCFADLLGEKSVADVLPEWKRFGRAVAWERSVRNGRGPGQTEWIDDPRVLIGGLYRYTAPCPTDVVFPGVTLAAGDVVRVAAASAGDPAVVRVADRETGTELGVVATASLRPV